MQDVLTFWEGLLSSVCDFLLTEPINYLFGIFLLAAVAGLFISIIKNLSM